MSWDIRVEWYMHSQLHVMLPCGWSLHEFRSFVLEAQEEL